eukprot:XP_019926056.1 PREDICTED: uncharacterized protein LOC109619725 [Crassostrea gigas]
MVEYTMTSNANDVIQTVTRQIVVLGLLLTVTFSVTFSAPLDPDLELMALVPPSRPSGFQNFQEMQRYLMELNRFYNMMSRPRYGRDVHQRNRQKLKKISNLLHLASLSEI